MSEGRATRHTSPSQSIVSMELDDVESNGKKCDRHDRPAVRSFLHTSAGNARGIERRSSLENLGRFGLLTPALALVPAVDGVRVEHVERERYREWVIVCLAVCLGE